MPRVKYRNLFAIEIVAFSFADFQNTKNRGPNFSWEEFPEMMRRHVGAQIGIQIYPLPKGGKEEAETTALEFADRLVKRMQGKDLT